jgi:hypothetical protein
MEGGAGWITAAEAVGPEDPPHPVVIAIMIAAKATPVSNSRRRALCSFGAQAKRLLSSVASDPKRVLRYENGRTPEPCVIAIPSRWANLCTALVETLGVLVIRAGDIVVIIIY